MLKSLAVFCGASLGHSTVWQDAARSLGTRMAERQIRLVYGGGGIGLMGVLADAALAAGGDVIGVIPEFLARREAAHRGLEALEITHTMHSRKHRMFELADGFVVFAGGLGTLDEAFEILTWKQLGLHDKPILICNVAGSATPLLAAIDGAIAMGFAHAQTRALFEVYDGVDAMLAAIA